MHRLHSNVVLMTPEEERSLSLNHDPRELIASCLRLRISDSPNAHSLSNFRGNTQPLEEGALSENVLSAIADLHQRIRLATGDVIFSSS
jgi:hypothetical protein